MKLIKRRSDNNEAGTILVTGATGNIGSELLKQLSPVEDRNIRVRAAVRSINNAVWVKAQGVQLVEMDYTKPETLSKAFEGIDKLFLNTPYQPDMVELTYNLVAEAKKAGTIKHIIKLSAMGADAEPGITVFRLHRQAEKTIEESGIPSTFLRPSGFMQNFVNVFGNSIRSHDAFYAPVGDGKISFVDVRDVAAVAVKVLIDDQYDRHNCKAYNITGSDAFSYGEAAEILSKEIRKKISYVNITQDDARKGMKDIGMDDWFINSLIELYAIEKTGYLSSISPVFEELIRKKPISFSQFAKDYADSFKSQIVIKK
jgi:uncharacterized protein YbjT (DUF2867 family)